jgi:hypothetical protein
VIRRATKIGIAVTCTVCGATKKPVGRAAPLGFHYCELECPGYHAEPLPGSLWPGETDAEFGFPCGDNATDRVIGLQRCPHDGARCHHECATECLRQRVGAMLSVPWRGFPVPGSEPVPDGERGER